MYRLGRNGTDWCGGNPVGRKCPVIIFTGLWAIVTEICPGIFQVRRYIFDKEFEIDYDNLLSIS
jgi:hypothetical protein